MLRRAPIIRRDHLLRQLSHPSDCYVIEIEAGLLVAEKAAIESAALVAAIGGDHGKSSRQRRRLTGGLRTQGQSDAAVQPTAALKQETAVPLIGQRESETDAVWFSVRSGALDRSRLRRGRTAEPRPPTVPGKFGEMRSVPGAEAGMGSAFVMASATPGELKLQHVGAMCWSAAGLSKQERCGRQKHAKRRDFSHR